MKTGNQIKDIKTIAKYIILFSIIISIAPYSFSILFLINPIKEIYITRLAMTLKGHNIFVML